MNITRNTFATIHYTVKDEDGTVLDSSLGADPLGYIHGNGYLIQGLERELEGKASGDKLQITVTPEDGYGVYDERLVTVLPRDRFDTDFPLEVGMKFQAGPAVVRIVGVDGNNITVDGNHELAGKVLSFDVSVVDVREATQQELDDLQMMSQCGGCGGGCATCGGGCGSAGCGSSCGCCS